MAVLDENTSHIRFKERNLTATSIDIGDLDLEHDDIFDYR